MTTKQLETLNLKVSILYDFQRGLNLMELQAKYHMSRQSVRCYIKLGKDNHKVLKSVGMRKESAKNK